MRDNPQRGTSGSHTESCCTPCTARSKGTKGTRCGKGGEAVLMLWTNGELCQPGHLFVRSPACSFMAHVQMCLNRLLLDLSGSDTRIARIVLSGCL